METIKNYLETMFRNLPPTPQVARAKAELYSMMEDKYTELIREGHTENEAVGTVISEFGNLDELSESLGLSTVMADAPQPPEQGRLLAFEEVENYLENGKITSLLTAIGVVLCILSPIPVIVLEALEASSLEFIGVFLLLVLIAFGTAALILSGISSSKWDYIEKQHCSIDYTSILFVNDEKAKFNTTYAISLAVGILACVLCALPAIILEGLAHFIPLSDDLSGAFVLFFVAVGVFLIIWSTMRMGRYKKLLSLNERAGKSYRNQDINPKASQTAESVYTDINGQDRDGFKGTPSSSEEIVQLILSVYNPTITCIYLIWSFTTFDWHITWIIWPISAILKKVLINIWGGKKKS